MRLSTLLLLALSACAAEEPVLGLIDGEGPSGDRGSKIYGGSAPDAPEHEATIAIHDRSSSGYVYTTPFCSGTLITSEWVLTAAHCVTSGSSVTSASRMAVYVGDNPSRDLSSRTWLVDTVVRHPSYSSTSLYNDIALLHLSTPVTDVTPVPGLPASEGLTNADVGTTVNFAGFGYQSNGSYGVKMQVDLPIGALGCGVSGCPSAGDTATQVSYRQSSAGPCSGDSGGPMFVYRSSGVYQGGVTSYGDSACRQYGVSTRVDAYESWISGYTGTSSGGGGGGGGGGTTTACSGYEYSATGSLSGAGDYDQLPGGSSYSAASGTHQGYLDGPSGADFDLYLYKYRRSSWSVVASATTSSADESVSYNGSSGTYAWLAYAYSGSGGYTFCLNAP